MNYYPPLTYKVPEEDDGLELRTILHKRLRISRTLLSRLKLTEKGITVNGVRQYTSVRVHTGDLVEARMEEERSDDILPQPMELDILFEDAFLLIVNKAPGIVVHPTHGHYTDTLANGVVHHWQERGESVRFRPIHRLDQDTSGVLAIAKNPYIHQHVSEQMSRQQVEKTYTAILLGHLKQDEGTVNAPIDRDPESPHYRIVTPSGYPSVTHYRVLERLRHATLASIRLDTGRTHQIRVHMDHLGHPLIGDEMYGSAAREAYLRSLPDSGDVLPELQRQALHASQLSFLHPMTGEQLIFTAALPHDMAELLDKLR